MADLCERAGACLGAVRACRRGAVGPRAVGQALVVLRGWFTAREFLGGGWPACDANGRPWADRLAALERAVRRAAEGGDRGALDAALAVCAAELAPLAGADEPEPAGAW